MKESIVSDYFIVEDANLCWEFLKNQRDYLAEPRGIKKDNLCKGLIIELQKERLLVRLSMPDANYDDPDKLWSMAELKDAHLIFDEVVKNQH